MSEEIIPAAAPEVVADVAEKVEDNLSNLTLAELSAKLEEIMADEARMQRAKEVEAVKSAFYRRLSREKAEAGLEEGADSPFTVIEEGFKAR